MKKSVTYLQLFLKVLPPLTFIRKLSDFIYKIYCEEIDNDQVYALIAQHGFFMAETL